MLDSLDSTYGIWLVSFFIETLLFGCGLLQAWLYFHWYPLDHLALKAMVGILTVSETVQIVFFFVSTYSVLITHFGDFGYLSVVNWMDTTQLAAGYISAMIVQAYFAYCIYILNRKKKVVPSLIVFLALVQIGSGIAQDVLSTTLGSFSKLDSTAPTSILQGAAALSCDILITGSLLLTLNTHKLEFNRLGVRSSTSSMLNTLMVVAINRGVVTAISAALNIILFLGIPHTFWFFLGLFPSSKLYMNSALATLNSRQYIRTKSDLRNWRSMTLHLQSASTADIRGVDVPMTPMDNPIRVHMHTETYLEPEGGNLARNEYIGGKV